MSGSSKYRADIDGLRGIAILSVLFFHTEAPAFSGGYVGVDIFL
jgi:peptidoglycan/LPS O-acetylase OafA/YrhL